MSMATTASLPSMRSTHSVPIRLVDPAEPKRIRIRIRGMSPLLLDPISDEVITAMIQKKKIQIAHDRPLHQVCEEKLDIIRDPDSGRLALPRKYLWSALHAAGEHVPYKGKMNIATASSPGKPAKSRLASFFMIETKRLELFNDDHQEPEWEIDLDIGNGATSKNGICRPKFEEWNLGFIFQYDEGDVNEKTIRKLLSEAGKKIGIGCKRACLKGGENGQFVVDDWEDITPTDWPRAEKATKKIKKSGAENRNGDGEHEEEESAIKE